MCDVCCEKFNLSTRKQVSCPYCPFKFCRECCSHYVLEAPEEPSCMNCKKPWTREFMADAFTQVWMNTAYRAKREQLLFERERSLMPATQHLAENEVRIRAMTNQNNEYQTEHNKNTLTISKFRIDPALGYENAMDIYAQMEVVAHQNAVLSSKIQYNVARINYLRNHTGGGVANEKRKFVRACPASDCRGFLSTAWKCGLCEVWVCPDCHEIKGHERDAEHTCDPGNLATARLLEKDSKPCPKCSSMIFKIHGCDQMYCTQCNTAFSWNTGRIETSRIHNPHYYEYLRQRAGTDNIRREIGDIPCGGMPYGNDIATRLFGHRLRNYQLQQTESLLSSAARSAIHVENVTLIRYRTDRIADNQDMRIKYMIGDYTEDEFKRQLQLKEQQVGRKNAIAAVLNTYLVVVSEIFRNLVATVNPPEGDQKFFENCLANIEEIRVFTNEALNRVSKMYKKCSVPHVNIDYSVA